MTYLSCVPTPTEKTRPYIHVLFRSRLTFKQDPSANDLRDGQRIVGNKNNRKRNECVCVYLCVWSTLNCQCITLLAAPEGLVLEVNKVDEAAGQNVCALFSSFLRLRRAYYARARVCMCVCLLN